MSTQNTKIAKSKFGGIRFPCEQRDVGDGYAASGECVTRQMTPEERERYGMAEPGGKNTGPTFDIGLQEHWRKKRGLTRLMEAREKLTKELYIELKCKGKTDGQIALDVLGDKRYQDAISLLKSEWELPYIAVDKKQGEAEEVGRLDEARVKLSKEYYVELKEAGMNDKNIMLDYLGIIQWDTLNKLKREWGLIGAFPGTGAAKKVEKINQAVKVDIEELKTEILFHAKLATGGIAENSNAAINSDPLGWTKTIMVGNEKTALDAADEFYTLQEEVAEIAEQMKLDHARMDTKLARMQTLKDALESVMVTI